MDERYKAVHASVARLLTSLGVDWEREPNYKDTPRRVATYLLDKFPSTEDKEVLRKVLSKRVFPSFYHGVVAQTGILVDGICPHHLMTVSYSIAIGYLPLGKVIGLSKLSRLADMELGVSITQEDGTAGLADSLTVMLGTTDIAVVVKGIHTCMVVRGAKQHGTKTVTSEMRGKFRANDSNIRSEFFALVNGNGGK